VSQIQIVGYGNGDNRGLGVRNSSDEKFVEVEGVTGVSMATLTQLWQWGQERHDSLIPALNHGLSEGSGATPIGSERRLPAEVELWVAHESDWERTVTGRPTSSHDTSNSGWIFKAPRGAVTAVGEDLGMRRDAVWQVPVPGLVGLIAPDGQVAGYGLGLDVTAMDFLASSSAGPAKLFYHSAALSPVFTLLNDDEASRIEVSLKVERHGLVVLNRQWEWTLSPLLMKVQADRLAQFWPIQDWTGIMEPGQFDYDETFALEDGDLLTLDGGPWGSIIHTVRRLDANWAPIAQRGGAAVVQVHPKDNVAVVLAPLAAGDRIHVAGQSFIAKQTIPFGHKIAVKDIGPGQPVIKYGEVIGLTGPAISQGEHVHVHNFDSKRGRGDLIAEKHAEAARS